MKQRLFGWSLASLDSPYDFFYYIFDGHPSDGEKKTLRLAFNQSIFLVFWQERNGWYFQDFFSSFNSFLNLICLMSCIDVNVISLFFSSDYGLPYLVSHWKILSNLTFRWRFYSFISFNNENFFPSKEIRIKHMEAIICLKTNSMM